MTITTADRTRLETAAARCGYGRRVTRDERLCTALFGEQKAADVARADLSVGLFVAYEKIAEELAA